MICLRAASQHRMLLPPVQESRPMTVSAALKKNSFPPGLTVDAPVLPGHEQVLTPDALTFLAALHREFEPRRQALLARRAERQRQFDAGVLPGFLPETASIRSAEWSVASQPGDLLDRRV